LRKLERTVDGDGDHLSQDEAVGANEGRYTIERVELDVLEILGRRSGLDQLNIELVLLRNCEEDSCAGIALWRSQCSISSHASAERMFSQLTYRESV